MLPCLQTQTKVSCYSLCEKNKRIVLQNYRVTVVNESVSITFDVLVLL